VETTANRLHALICSHGYQALFCENSGKSEFFESFVATVLLLTYFLQQIPLIFFSSSPQDLTVRFDATVKEKRQKTETRPEGNRPRSVTFEK